MDQLYLSGCHLSISAESLNIQAPSRFAAYALRRRWASDLAVSAKKLKRRRAIVSWPGCDRPYRIPTCILNYDCAMIKPQPQRGNYLLGADYLRVTEFIKEKREEGRIVVITSMWDDICLHTNDLLKPERGTIMPHQWTGFNYSFLWRDSKDDYKQLIERLVRDGCIPQFQYRLRRPDGSFGEYQTDYYYVENYLSVPVRIGVSRVEDWRLLPEPSSN
ncbi:MAG: hypothetical protein F6K36_02100 [Symploca sp. SIO3C6]|uniref:Uncharacterized protein n=1 Tax=Symploca sp. SIO1C4 TaxID=2607765 RepID=A0A6B3NPJ1_9CYAN|nr:hypothetical protein [Symploca sp. SIO3C6]NER32242.1 hypothetical protein [Symploca sp. SIO1C4]NET05729.1 hypothetical protein [Symploca sp. SIO2B6]